MKMPSPQHTRAAVLKVMLMLMAALVFGLVIAGTALARSLRMPAAAFPNLDAEVIRELDLKIRTDIQVNAPPFVFTLSRLASHFVKIEPEVRSAMRTVRGARLSVYELSEPPARQTKQNLIEALDAHCETRGWQRVACVMDHHDLVLVYLSDAAATDDEVQVFVMTLSEFDLVAVGASGDLASLSDLVTEVMNRHGSGLLAGLR